MIVTSFTDYEIVKKMRTCYLVRIFFDSKARKTECFYISEKQLNKLRNVMGNVSESRVRNTYPLAVFDGDRYVWCGIEYPDYSDREWLMKNFNAQYKSEFIIENSKIEVHVPEKVQPIESGPDAELIR